MIDLGYIVLPEHMVKQYVDVPSITDESMVLRQLDVSDLFEGEPLVWDTLEAAHARGTNIQGRYLIGAVSMKRNEVWNALLWSSVGDKAFLEYTIHSYSWAA